MFCNIADAVKAVTPAFRSEVFNDSNHIPHRPLHTDQNGSGNNTMSDAKFPNFVESLESFYGVVAQSVSGSNADLKLVCQFNGVHDIGENLLTVLGSFGVTKCSRMDVDKVNVYLVGNFYLVWIGIDEDADENTAIL